MEHCFNELNQFADKVLRASQEDHVIFSIKTFRPRFLPISLADSQ